MTCSACTWDVDGVEVSPIQQRAILRDLHRALVDPQLDGVVLARALYTGEWKEGWDSAVECVDARIEHLTGHIEGLANAVPPAPPTRRGFDALDVWDGAVAPGGWVCDVCRLPIESEPCREHQPKAYAEMRAEASRAATPSAAPASGDLAGVIERAERLGRYVRHGVDAVAGDDLKGCADEIANDLRAHRCAPRGEGETERADAGVVRVSCTGHVATFVPEEDADDQPCPWCVADEATAAMDRANSRLGALVAAPSPSVPVDGDGSADTFDLTAAIEAHLLCITDVYSGGPGDSEHRFLVDENCTEATMTARTLAEHIASRQEPCPWHGPGCDGTGHEDRDPAMPLGERESGERS